MNSRLALWLLIGGLMPGLACDTERPTAPSTVSAPPIANQPQPPPTQPPPLGLSGEPVAIYVFSGRLDYAIRDFTAGSQYLLYENGVFGLRYDAFSHVYLGTYQQDNATIMFRFDDAWTWDQGWSCLSDSRPTRGLCPFAMGTLQGELLEIRYGDSMQHSDFEDAVYRRVESSALSSTPGIRLGGRGETRARPRAHRALASRLFEGSEERASLRSLCASDRETRLCVLADGGFRHGLTAKLRLKPPRTAWARLTMRCNSWRVCSLELRRIFD